MGVSPLLYLGCMYYNTHFPVCQWGKRFFLFVFADFFGGGWIIMHFFVFLRGGLFYLQRFGFLEDVRGGVLPDGCSAHIATQVG